MRKLSRSKRRHRGERGQSLIESALILPFLFLLLFNAINFAYFFYVGINLVSAPRNGVEYSIQGFATPSATASLPSATLIRDLTYDNVTLGGTLTNASSTPIRVCTKVLGVTSNIAGCTSYGSSYTFPANVADPEAGTFVLHRVDMVYTVQPLIPAQPFGITLLSSYTLRRSVLMRAID